MTWLVERVCALGAVDAVEFGGSRESERRLVVEFIFVFVEVKLQLLMRRGRIFGFGLS